MNPNCSTHPGVAVSPPTPLRRRVIDAPTRMFHWLFALCFAGAYLSADSERLRLIHVTLGYSMAGLLAFRVLYGLVGPRQARLSALWGKLTPGLRFVGWLRSVVFPGTGAGAVTPAPLSVRQVPLVLMAAAIAGLLVLVVPLSLSGYATFNDWGGEWLAELHEATAELLLALVFVHLGLMSLMSLLRRKNQMTPMLTGHIEGKGPDLARRNHAWLAALMLVALVSYWGWEWQTAPGTAGKPPPGLSSQQAGHKAASQDDDD